MKSEKLITRVVEIVVQLPVLPHPVVVEQMVTAAQIGCPDDVLYELTKRPLPDGRQVWWTGNPRRYAIIEGRS